MLGIILAKMCRKPCFTRWDNLYCLVCFLENYVSCGNIFIICSTSYEHQICHCCLVTKTFQCSVNHANFEHMVRSPLHGFWTMVPINKSAGNFCNQNADNMVVHSDSFLYALPSDAGHIVRQHGNKFCVWLCTSQCSVISKGKLVLWLTLWSWIMEQVGTAP